VAATSFAAALVSGAAARYLAPYPTATPAAVWTYLSNTSASLVTDHRSPNATKPFNPTYGKLLQVVQECP
jgi:hypothetical protein